MADGCGEACGAQNLSHAAPAYRRALWIVVILNLAMGLVEIIGGAFELNVVPPAVRSANDCMRHGLSSLRHP